MTGKITMWYALANQGFIQSDDGRQLRFSGADIWPYDLARMDRGQVVSFDLREGPRATAVNVRRSAQEPMVTALKTSPTAGHLQYEGFDHRANLREYQFRRLISGQRAQCFVVCAELSLLAQYGIGLQEGPALCECFLAAALRSCASESSPAQRYVLTSDYLQEHVAKRSGTAAILGRKKFRRPTAPLAPSTNH